MAIFEFARSQYIWSVGDDTISEYRLLAGGALQGSSIEK
jgi:hypothetical protein